MDSLRLPLHSYTSEHQLIALRSMQDTIIPQQSAANAINSTGPGVAVELVELVPDVCVANDRHVRIPELRNTSLHTASFTIIE